MGRIYGRKLDENLTGRDYSRILCYILCCIRSGSRWLDFSGKGWSQLPLIISYNSLPVGFVHLHHDCPASIRASRPAGLLLVADDFTRLSLSSRKASVYILNVFCSCSSIWIPGVKVSCWECKFRPMLAAASLLFFSQYQCSKGEIS